MIVELTAQFFAPAQSACPVDAGSANNNDDNNNPGLRSERRRI